MSKIADGPSFETGMLAYARSIQIAEGLFFATQSDAPEIRTSVEVREKGVRGQSSEDKAKNPGQSNPQSVEVAVIPQGHDGVELCFSIRFMPLAMRPHACGNTKVGETYQRLAEGYRRAGGFRVLATLYVWNVANARFAWRNRFQSDAMSVMVKFESVTLGFDPLLLDLERQASEVDLAAALTEGDSDDLKELIDGIAEGLSDVKGSAFTVHVQWNAEMAPGQEIFPSQEYVREEKRDGSPSRVYAKLPTWHHGRQIQQASMHSQKIGAALRHIDIWHGSEEHDAPIAVNPYGGVQQTGNVLRRPQTKASFYDLRAKAEPLLSGVDAAKSSDELSGDAHFVMANLVRGGVFGSSTKKAEANG